MAGDWIKMRCDLVDDPAVIAIATATGMEEFAVVGRLHRLWSWAGNQTTDGNAVGVTESFVDRYISFQGFAKAMVAAGWLTITNDGIAFPKFDVHNSKSAKERGLTQLRVSKSRNGATVTKSLPEKRREEKRDSATQNPLPPGKPAAKRKADPLFDAIMEVTGADPKASGSHIGRVKKALLSAEPPYTPADVRLLPSTLRQHGLTVPVSLGVVEKYIGWLRTPPANSSDQLVDLTREMEALKPPPPTIEELAARDPFYARPEEP